MSELKESTKRAYRAVCLPTKTLFWTQAIYKHPILSRHTNEETFISILKARGAIALFPMASKLTHVEIISQKAFDEVLTELKTRPVFNEEPSKLSIFIRSVFNKLKALS